MRKKMSTTTKVIHLKKSVQAAMGINGLYHLYAARHISSNFIKIGIASNFIFRNDSLGVDYLFSVNFESRDQAADAEAKIKSKYGYFNQTISAKQAKELSIPKNGITEYFKFSNDEAIYALLWVKGLEHKYVLSPFSQHWLQEIYPIKKQKPFQKTVDDQLLSLPNTRADHYSDSHVKALRKSIELNGVQHPIVLDKDSKIFSGIHTAEAIRWIPHMHTVPAILCDETWMQTKEIYDVSVCLNNTEHHRINKPLSRADILRNINNTVIEIEEKTKKNLNGYDDFTDEQINQFSVKYNISNRESRSLVDKVITKIREKSAVSEGLFIPKGKLNETELIQKAQSYHLGRAVICHVSSKIHDMVGAAIRATIVQQKPAALILTYDTFKDRGRSNSKDLEYLAQVKEMHGIDIVIEVIEQIKQVTESSNNTEEKVCCGG
jgi:hypothetical protein